jgi:cell wall-associated NlpC family hydrolase
MTEWASDYTDVPFAEHGRTRAGVDCWGLVRLVLAEQRGLELPDYGRGYDSTEDRAEVPAAIRSGLRDGWQSIPEPLPGALVIFNIWGVPMHCGVTIPGRRFLHAQKGVGVVVERLDSAMWIRRIEGFYRYGS